MVTIASEFPDGWSANSISLPVNSLTREIYIWRPCRSQDPDGQDLKAAIYKTSSYTQCSTISIKRCMSKHHFVDWAHNIHH